MPQQLCNLMHIMLLNVYCSSFSAITACTFDWLIDGRSLVKIYYFINNVFFRVRSITKTAYILVRNTEITVGKYKVVHEIWKMQYQFANPKKDWLTWWCSSRFTLYCTFNSSYCKKWHIFSVLSFYKHWFLSLNPRG